MIYFDFIDLAKRLPTDEDPIPRLDHVHKNGHFLYLKISGQLKGYAELYVLNDVPEYPVIPWPKNEQGGKFLYCFAAVCEKGYIKDLIDMAKRTFKDCKYLCYHRHKRGNALHIERM